MSAYEGIAASLSRSVSLLNEDGMVLLEVGSGQAELVKGVMSAVQYLCLSEEVYDCHDQLRCLTYVRTLNRNSVS